MLQIGALPGEANRLAVAADPPSPTTLEVTDAGAPLTTGTGCLVDPTTGRVGCSAVGVSSVGVRAGDGNDSVSIRVALPTVLDGGPGDDVLQGGPGSDVLTGGPGRDVLAGGPGTDVLLAADRRPDQVTCGAADGDRVRADVADEITGGCSGVDYGPTGRAGPIHAITGGGRFVHVPGQLTARIDRRLLPDVLFLVARYHLRLGDGYSLSRHHQAQGEHPLGLAIDIYPGPGASWNDVDRLARWAEPRQNHPRWPFRWVGYNGDYNHGRGNHLHLSWMHSPGRYGHPVRRVWVFAVRRSRAMVAVAGRPAPTGVRYVVPEGDR